MSERQSTEVRLGDELEALRSEVEQLQFFAFAERLRDAFRQLFTASAGQMPLVVAMLGATGVGKSQLFSVLIGVPDGSPSSPAKRGFTTQPYIAASLQNKAFTDVLDLPDAIKVVPNRHDWSSLILIDTPDTNSAHDANKLVTRTVLEKCDVVLYVTDNESYAKDEMILELRQWASQKTWLFVLNKFDCIKDNDQQPLRDSFENHLRKCGFCDDDLPIFEVSATQPQNFKFEALQHEILQQRPKETVEKLKRMNCLGAVAATLADYPLEPLEQKIRELTESEQGLNARVRQIYRDAYAEDHVAAALKSAVDERVWTILAGRVWGPMVLAIWIRSRISWLSGSMLLGRIALRGLGAGPILGSVLNFVLGAVRGTLALRFILDLLGPGFQTKLERVRDLVRRLIEDQGLTHLLPELRSNERSIEESLGPSRDSASLDLLGLQRATTLANQGWDFARGKGNQLLAYLTEDELLGTLRRDVEQISSKQVLHLAYWPITLLANLPALVALGHILFRLVQAWQNEQYLTLPFYGTAAAIFAASCLPGYALFAFLIWWSASREKEMEDTAAGLDAPLVTAPLRIVCARLQEFIRRTKALHKLVKEQQRAIRNVAPEMIGAGLTLQSQSSGISSASSSKV